MYQRRLWCRYIDNCIPENSTLFGINASLVVELPVMFLVMILLTSVPLVKGKTTRLQGIALLAI